MDNTTAGYNNGEDNHIINEGQVDDLPASSSNNIQFEIEEQQQHEPTLEDDGHVPLSWSPDTHDSLPITDSEIIIEPPPSRRSIRQHKRPSRFVNSIILGPNGYSMFHKPGNTAQETIDAENACEGEIKQFVDLNVLRPVYRVNPNNKHQKLLHTSMQITKKYKSIDRSYDKTKGRFIMLGDKVDRNQYEANETSSPTGHNISLF